VRCDLHYSKLGHPTWELNTGPVCLPAPPAPPVHRVGALHCWYGLPTSRMIRNRMVPPCSGLHAGFQSRPGFTRRWSIDASRTGEYLLNANGTSVSHGQGVTNQRRHHLRQQLAMRWLLLPTSSSWLAPCGSDARMHMLHAWEWGHGGRTNERHCHAAVSAATRWRKGCPGPVPNTADEMLHTCIA
jgi:hypothetical protein